MEEATGRGGGGGGALDPSPLRPGEIEDDETDKISIELTFREFYKT